MQFNKLRKFNKLKSLFTAAIIGLSVGLTGCMDDATVASHNIQKAADNFEVPRRIVFYNGITGDYILEIQGLCSMDLNQTGTAFSAVCKTPDGFKRHTLVRSDNVTAFVEQLSPKQVSTSFYRVTFKPSVIIPDVDVR